MPTTEQDNNKQTILSQAILRAAREYHVNLTAFSCNIGEFGTTAKKGDTVKVRVDGGTNTFRKNTKDYTVSNRSGSVRTLILDQYTVSDAIDQDDLKDGITFERTAYNLAQDLCRGLSKLQIKLLTDAAVAGKIKFLNVGAEGTFARTSLKPIAKAITNPTGAPMLHLDANYRINLMPDNKFDFDLDGTGLFSAIQPTGTFDEHVAGFAGYKNGICCACAMPAEAKAGFNFTTQLQIFLPENGLSVLYTEYENTITREKFAAMDIMLAFEIGDPGSMLLLGTDNTYQPKISETMELSATEFDIDNTAQNVTVTVKTLSPVKVEKAESWMTVNSAATKNAATGVITTTLTIAVPAYTDKKGKPRFGGVTISDGTTFKGVAIRQSTPEIVAPFIEPS